MDIIVPRKRGLHFEARTCVHGVDGSLIYESGWRHNILHDLGEELILNMLFEPMFTTYSWMILTHNAAYTHGTLTLAGPAADDFAATLEVADYIYVVGGYDAGAVHLPLTGSYNAIATNADDDTVTLTAAPTAGNGDLDGGVVVIRPMNFGIGLDMRTALTETDTIATAEAYEEDGTGYYREKVDPIDGAATYWTVSQDATTGDYQATSSQVTFVCGGADWQANRNAFLVAGLVDTDASDTYLHSAAADWSNDVLISSVALGSTFDPSSGQTRGVQFRMRLRESS